MATFTNQATLAYNGLTTTSNVVTGEVTQVLTMWKDATVDTYRVGDIVTYVISIQNGGTVDFTNLTFTDNLGAYTFNTTTLVPLTYTGDNVLYYLNGILQNAPTVTPGPPLTINNISVLAGGTTTLVYRTLVNSAAPLSTGSQIVNTATLNGIALSAPVTAQETVTVDATALLTITKAINPPSVVENGTITYTFTLQNVGATEASAAANIVISDTFAPVLSNITVTLNGTPWTEAGNYTYNTTTGLFQTVAGRVTVPAATFTQNPTTGLWSVTPGTTVLTVTGTI